MHQGKFGSCCKDLKDAMTMPPTSLLRVEQNGVLYLAIGYSEATHEQRRAWFDQALLFCPFCGVQIQDSAEIKGKSSQA